MGEFAELGRIMIGGATSGMSRFAHEVMDESLEQCPIETGALRDSAKIEDVEREGAMVKVTFGYGYGDEVNPTSNRLAADYAVPVHERLDIHHEHPTKAKFLEDPVLERAPDLGPSLAASIRLAILTGGKNVTLASGQMVNGKFVYQETLDRDMVRQNLVDRP